MKMVAALKSFVVNLKNLKTLDFFWDSAFDCTTLKVDLTLHENSSFLQIYTGKSFKIGD